MKNWKKKEIFFEEIHQKGEKRKKKEIRERKRRRGRKETIAKQQQQLKTKLRGAQLSALFAHG
jgi:predicted transposase YdaD